ncbi:MAG: PQQ-binding-like beta-propeller repeat protein [Verrucomicrobiales bacterium]
MREENDEQVNIAPARPRWWLLAGIVLASAATLAILWIVPHRSQQHFNLDFARVVLGTLGAMAIWLLWLSRLPWRVRWTVVGSLLGALAILATVFRLHGVDGNLVPILEFRWARHTLPPPLSLATPSTASAPIGQAPGAADFPQFLGPNRNGILDGPALATDWAGHPPARLWRQAVGAAWSGFAVAGSIAVTQEQRGESEMVVAYDLSTGRLLWSHADSARFASELAGEGPRATPNIAGDRVFTVGATGLLNCLLLETGRVLWSKDVVTENAGRQPDWGLSGSPLVFGDTVVVNPGGDSNRSVVAYAVHDGSVRWAAGTGGASYSSPLATTIEEIQQVLLFGGSLVGHDARLGTVLWTYPWPGGHPHIAMPVQITLSDWILSSGYGTGSGRISIQRDASGQWSANEVWRTNRFKSKFANPVKHRGHLYGLDDGVLACLDAATGDLRWRDGKYGHGQVLLVGDGLLVMAENGEVALIDPQPDGQKELARFRALNGKTWNPPALAGEYLVVRNDKEAACYRLPTRR